MPDYTPVPGTTVKYGDPKSLRKREHAPEEKKNHVRHLGSLSDDGYSRKKGSDQAIFLLSVCRGVR